jgi:hypothetical protein
VSATSVLLLVILGALALVGIGCTILGLRGELRQNWTKR